jgi:hypothetical protein
MDLDFTAEDLAFGAEVRAFIAEAFDDDMRPSPRTALSTRPARSAG